MLPEDHPLADRPSVSLKELDKYPYIGINRDYDHDVDEILTAYGYSDRPFLVSRDEQAVIALVREGLGFSIIAGMHVAYASEGVVGIPLKPRYIRDVGLAVVSLEALSPAERKFIEVSREVVNELIEDGVVDPPR